jgi:hypothetical protein
MDKMPTPRTPIVVNGISTFCAAFEYTSDSSGSYVPTIAGKAYLDQESEEVTVEPPEAPFVESQFSLSTMPNDEFVNPSAELPVKAAAFLAQLDLSCTLPALSTKYLDNDKHFRHDPQAMLKALILRRLLGLRWYTDLERYLLGHPDEADMLGFRHLNGKRIVPNHSTFTDFERRLEVDGARQIMDILVIEIQRKLKKMGLDLGVNVAVDSTPIEGKENDPDIQFNPHYKMKGYKVHGAYDLDFQILLAFDFTKINDGDSPHLLPLLDKLHDLGLEPRNVYADGAYASFANLAVLNTNHKVRAHFNMRSNSKENRSGTDAAIKRLYRTLWKCEGFNPDASTDEILTFLMQHGHIEAVGAYHWNRYVRAWRDNYDSTKKMYNRRAAIEAFHGHMKQQMLLEKFMDARGIRRAERHVLMSYIAMLAVALCRLQHGISDGLSCVKCFN